MPTIFPLSPEIEAIQALVQNAVATKQPVEAIGGETQRHIGQPTESVLSPISTIMLKRRVDYTPDDLVIVADAGVTIVELNMLLAENNQILPLEVIKPDQQTLGGVVASRANSLTRNGFGSVRDWLIGCQVIGGDAQIIVGGGKVVKNVAGYDLLKLYCGSWGTLGIITQVALKVMPRPQANRTLLVTLNADRNSEEALDSLHRILTPTFSYLLNAAAAKAVLGDGAPDAQFVVVGFDGNEDAVASLSESATNALEPFAFQIISLPTEIAAKFRPLLRDLPQHFAPLTARFNILPSQVGAFVRMLEWTGERGGIQTTLALADTGVGIVWAHFYPPDSELDDYGEWSGWSKFYLNFRDKAERVGGSYVLERMPEIWRRNGVAVWSPILQDAEWMKKIKHTFDPNGIFSPGRFIGGI